MFSYAGRKDFLKDKVNRMISNSAELQYCEPFLGSGGIYRNLNKKNIKKYIIGDKDKNIIKIWKAFFNIDSYSKLLEIRNRVFKDFGDIKKNKDSYYKFRSWYNSNKLNENSVEAGICLYLLFDSCINGMARFGPNGFNQSFGNRGTLLSTEEFYKIKEKQKITELHNSDYRKLLSNFSGIAFLDPPYYSQAASYSEGFNLNNHVEYLEFIKELKCSIIYTDIINEHNSSILKNWNMSEIGEIRSKSPTGKKRLIENLEVIFYNFEYKESNNFSYFNKGE